MKIEPATKNDLDVLCTLFNQSRSANGSFSDQPYSLAEFMKAIDGEEILVARRRDDLVGFASVWANENFLHHLYVSPEHIGKGIGKRLIAECVRIFGPRMSLKCIKANTQACGFYEHLGWQAAEEGSGPQGPYILYVCGRNL